MVEIIHEVSFNGTFSFDGFQNGDEFLLGEKP